MLKRVKSLFKKHMKSFTCKVKRFYAVATKIDVSTCTNESFEGGV